MQPQQSLVHVCVSLLPLLFMSGCTIPEALYPVPRVTDQSELMQAIQQKKDAAFVYPPVAKQLGWGGWVAVEATITTRGDLVNTTVYEHSGCPALIVDAMDQVERLFPIPADISVPGRKVLTFKIPYYYEPTARPTSEGGDILHKSVAEALKMRVRERQQYPVDALQAGHEGVVLTRFVIKSDGTISQVEIVESSGHPELDEDAVNTLKGIEYAYESRCFQEPHPHEVVLPVTYSVNEFRAHPSPDYEWLRAEMFERIKSSKFYPRDAMTAELEGRAVVTAVVTSHGEICRTWIAQSSSVPLLDQTAIYIVQNISPISLKYKLARPTVTIQIPITFKLNR